jgi:hypothetical protein
MRLAALGGTDECVRHGSWGHLDSAGVEGSGVVEEFFLRQLEMTIQDDDSG